MATNFYEALDDVFEKLIEDKRELFDELVDIKSDIIKAYEKSHYYECRYIANTLKPRSFKITEDGRVVSV
jgi:hypothetical protein